MRGGTGGCGWVCSVEGCSVEGPAGLIPCPGRLRSPVLLGFDDGLIVILWSCVLFVVQAKHVRAELLNSNKPTVMDRPFK